MDTPQTRTARPGLRERKKQRTRETIATAALQLFAERGYTRTTLEDIAGAAEVSKATIFAYFDSKEDILFPEERPFYEQLRQRLEQRPPEVTTFDVLHDLLATQQAPDETFRQRLQIVRDAGVLGRHRGRYTRVEQLLADSIATDLGAAPGDLRATMLAAAAAAALVTAGDSLQPESGEAISYGQALTILEQMFNLLRSGLNQLEAPAANVLPAANEHDRAGQTGKSPMTSS